MPFFGVYNPASFGWAPNTNIVAFDHGGAKFPSGVHSATAPLFTGLINDLLAAGFHLPATGNSNVDGNWGYYYRDVRGATNLSFHAFGLAIDLDAPHNPMTTDPTARGTMPANAGAIARKWGMEWGGDWSGRRDLMHFEVHLAPSEIAAWVSRLSAPVTKPPATDSAGDSTHVGVTTLKSGMNGQAVRWVQRRLNLQPSAHKGYDAATVKWVKRYQQFHLLDVDGIVGPETWNPILNAPIIVGERRTFTGCTGPDVAWLQRKLGFVPAKTPAFGPKTRAAVQAVQGRHEQPTNGIVEHPTWVVLGINPPK